MTDTKTRAPRKPTTEFGQSLRGFVGSVNPAKLAIKVGAIIGESDTDKVSASIGSLVRKAGQNSGVVSVRSKPLVEAVIQSVVELDETMGAKGEKLRKDFQYEAISNANREPGANWLVRLKGGEEVPIKNGPKGDGFYKLVFVREIEEDEAPEGEDNN